MTAVVSCQGSGNRGQLTVHNSLFAVHRLREPWETLLIGTWFWRLGPCVKLLWTFWLVLVPKSSQSSSDSFMAQSRVRFDECIDSSAIKEHRPRVSIGGAGDLGPGTPEIASQVSHVRSFAFLSPPIAIQIPMRVGPLLALTLMFLLGPRLGFNLLPNIDHREADHLRMFFIELRYLVQKLFWSRIESRFVRRPCQAVGSTA